MKDPLFVIVFCFWIMVAAVFLFEITKRIYLRWKWIDQILKTTESEQVKNFCLILKKWKAFLLENKVDANSPEKQAQNLILSFFCLKLVFEDEIDFEFFFKFLPMVPDPICRDFASSFFDLTYNGYCYSLFQFSLEQDNLAIGNEIWQRLINGKIITDHSKSDALGVFLCHKEFISVLKMFKKFDECP